jgi:phosphoenolpyruvate-protein kinase (PTS system EI component)
MSCEWSLIHMATQITKAEARNGIEVRLCGNMSGEEGAVTAREHGP